MDTGELPQGEFAVVFGSKNKHALEDAQLLAASYDHALLLAALTTCAGFIRMMNSYREDGYAMDVISINFPGFPPLLQMVALDPFGCPILTDELRAELERLLGLNSAEIARKSPAEGHPAKEPESQVSQQ